jgi:GLPGLI family protein
MDSTKMAPEQMAEIQAQLKKQMERDYILSFTQTESNWKQAESLGGGPATASSGGMTMVINTGSQDRVLYKNLADQTFQREEDMMGKEFLVKDTLEAAEWELTGESKKIGNYTAQKATYTRIIDSQRFSTGMTEMENVKDTIQVVAWFTPEIPVSHGPENYFGLPGLILEVQNQGRILICEKIELNPSADPVKIEQPKRGKVVSREEFRAVQEESMKQMMNQYQGKPGSGNQFTIRIGN